MDQKISGLILFVIKPTFLSVTSLYYTTPVWQIISEQITLTGIVLYPGRISI